MPSPEQWEQASEKQMKDLMEWTMDCLKRLKIGCQERRKRTTLRVIRFGPGHRCVEVGHET